MRSISPLVLIKMQSGTVDLSKYKKPLEKIIKRDWEGKQRDVAICTIKILRLTDAGFYVYR